METKSGRTSRLGSARAALIVFVVYALAMVPLLVHWGHKWWFWADDWDFLANRTGGNLGDLFRGHYQHWVTLPVLAYRLLWSIFGIRSSLCAISRSTPATTPAMSNEPTTRAIRNRPPNARQVVRRELMGRP